MPPPEIIASADLTRLSTFALPARARQLVVLNQVEQIPELPREPTPMLVLGGGSNTVFLGDWPGQILLNRLRGIESEVLDDEWVRVRAAAGENWHHLVRWCLDRGLYGIENLVMIPGSVGAAPMQNIGAYGVELSERLESVEAWDYAGERLVDIAAADCGLAYRDSRFKSVDRGRFLITAITLRLSRTFRPNTDYTSLRQALEKRACETPGPRQLAASIMRLRRQRLPDPGRIANAGSFFKNPVLSATAASALLDEHPALPHWSLPDDRVKLSAAWMIEHLGWKGRGVGDAVVSPNHALVLINRGAARAADLIALIENIQSSTTRTFGLRLEPEPVLIGLPGQNKGA